MAEQYFLAPLDQAVVGVIKPNMMQTHESLRSYNSDARKCYFKGERNLKYFKAYNQENCLLECRANFTLVWCGCVAFYMPRKWPDLINRNRPTSFDVLDEPNTPICGQGRVDCVEVIQGNWYYNYKT